MSKPVIGITIGGRADDPDEGTREYASYKAAIEEAGGEVRFLSPKPLTPETAKAELEGLDGILFTGGIDIHPDNYDARNEPGDESLSTDQLIEAYHMHCSLDRDAFELPLARAAYDMQLPILGICRGLQLLNVALGGSLVKDIRTGRKHWAIRKEEDGEFGVSRKHEIAIAPDSRFARIVGTANITVNSRHHQGVIERDRSPRLRAVAASPDGIIEAVEGTDHPWAVAVQWHPERKKDEYVNEKCLPLFTAFLAAAQAQ
jgi:gamma-glutamyl-gamma-aminobutyrate hydrolase PuuD